MNGTGNTTRRRSISEDHCEGMSIDSVTTGGEPKTIKAPPLPIRDRFGFFLSDEFHQFLELPVEERQRRKDKETQRERKWRKMVKEKRWHTFINLEKGTMNPLLKERIRKGIPDTFRGYVWNKLIDTSEIRRLHPDYHRIDLSKVSPVTIDEVRYLLVSILLGNTCLVSPVYRLACLPSISTS